MHATSPAGDGRHLRSIPPARLALINRIARIRLPRGPHAAARVSAEFLRTYYRGVGEEDLAARTPQALAHAAHCHLELGRRRTPGQSLVRVFNPDPERDGVSSWRAKDLCRSVEARFGVAYSENGMLRLLHDLDLSWQKARPIPPEADLKAQARFKKNSPA